MIQSNELKIRNRFKRELRSQRGLEYDNDFILTEEWMGKLFSNDKSIALQDLFPIELTEELLLNNCGFKRADKSDSYGGILSPDLPNGNRMRLVNLEWRTKHYTTKFETLHHFQNWWYDNFQTELEINL